MCKDIINKHTHGCIVTDTPSMSQTILFLLFPVLLKLNWLITN